MKKYKNDQDVKDAKLISKFLTAQYLKFDLFETKHYSIMVASEKAVFAEVKTAIRKSISKYQK